MSGELRPICGYTGELLYIDADGDPFHAHQCPDQELVRGGKECRAPEWVPDGRCVDCGVDTDPASDDPAVQGCYANRGFGHVRVVGRVVGR